MKILIQSDPIGKLDFINDSTTAMWQAFLKLGCEVWHATPHDITQAIYKAELRLYVDAKRYDISNESFTALNGQGADIKNPHKIDDFDIVMIRQDPPFDMNYLANVQLLNSIDNVFNNSTLVVNNPYTIAYRSEKLYATEFAEYMPETIVTSSLIHAANFLQKHGTIILKDLFGAGGDAVTKVDDSASLKTLMHESNSGAVCNTKMLQEYIPNVTTQGDIRAIICNGKLITAIKRVPQQGDFRANMVLGGVAKAVQLTHKQEEICHNVAMKLLNDGIYIAGIDLLGDKLIEINITSPTGIRAANNIYQHNFALDIAKELIDIYKHHSNK